MGERHEFRISPSQTIGRHYHAWAMRGQRQLPLKTSSPRTTIDAGPSWVVSRKVALAVVGGSALGLPMSKYIQVVSTAPDKETAQKLATLLVERRLAACVQVSGPIESTYWWQGQVETSTEWRLTAKSRSDLFPAIEAAVREIHPYTVPELLATRLDAGHLAYLEWMDTELSPPESGSGR
jgi:periplasmic divalent cation tolerance protein